MSPEPAFASGSGPSDEVWAWMFADFIAALLAGVGVSQIGVRNVVGGTAGRELPSKCPHCRRRVRVLWSGPSWDDDSRPVFLTCRSEPPCDWQVRIPAGVIVEMTDREGRR